MKSTEDIIALYDERREAAVTDANEGIELLLDQVIAETAGLLDLPDTDEVKQYTENSSRTALQASYFVTQLNGRNPFMLLMSPSDRFAHAVAELAELKALSEVLGEALLIAAVGTGVIGGIVRTEDGKVDFPATLESVDFASPYEIAQMVVDKVGVSA